MKLDVLFNLEQTPLVLVDIDGTCSEFAPTSEEAVIVPEFLDAARAYHRRHPGGLVFVTGRDKVSAERMIYPENEGIDQRFPVLTSHGAVYTSMDGKVHELPYNPSEKNFINYFIERTLEFFRQNFPQGGIDIRQGGQLGKLNASFTGQNNLGPVLEIKRDGLLVYSQSIVDPDLRKEQHNLIVEFLEDIMASELNPEMRAEFKKLQDDKAGSKSFAVKHETEDQLEVRGPMSKGASLFAHGILQHGMARRVITFVDTLGPDGTDRTMAKAVKALGGTIVQVQNPGREQSFPQLGDPVFPDLVFTSPTGLARSFSGSIPGCNL